MTKPTTTKTHYRVRSNTQTKTVCSAIKKKQCKQMNFNYRVTIYDLNKMQEAVLKNLPLRPLWAECSEQRMQATEREICVIRRKQTRKPWRPTEINFYWRKILSCWRTLNMEYFKDSCRMTQESRSYLRCIDKRCQCLWFLEQVEIRTYYKCRVNLQVE